MEISKTKTSLLASLHNKKWRLRHGLFIAEGEKCVADMLGVFDLDCLVACPEWIGHNPGIVQSAKGRIFEAGHQTIRKVSSLSTPPEVLAAFHLPQYYLAEESTLPGLSPDGFYLMVDGIQDPGNLGTIIRTADWFGLDTIYASQDTVDVFNSKTVQSSMGSLRRVRVIYADLEELIIRSKVRNVYGTLLGGDDIFKTTLEKEGVVIMGNEGNGISERIRKLVTHSLMIPANCPQSCPDSLNVAVATGIVLAEFRGHRN